MCRIASACLLSVLLAILPACKKQLAPEVPEIAPASAHIGDSYYTQFALHYENNRYRTTNYQKGVLLPINTRVTLRAINSKIINVAIEPSGQELEIENIEKFSKDDIGRAFDKIFSKKPVNLKVFSKLEKDHIAAGTVAKGMHKAAVLAAIGYPPQHETPSLDGSEWTYWRTRFDKFVVTFKNGVVADVRT